MLITEKRLRQIVSSELKRMFLREATVEDAPKPVDLNNIPNPGYKAAYQALEPLMKRFSTEASGGAAPNIYKEKFMKEFAPKGKDSYMATAVKNAARNEALKDNSQRFQAAIIALYTGGSATNGDIAAMNAGKSPPSLSIGGSAPDTTWKGFVESVKGSESGFLNNFITIANGDPSAAAPAGPNRPAPAQPPNEGTPYTVATGDTISGILNKYYNIPKSASSQPLYAAALKFFTGDSKPSDPGKIKVGMTMSLPNQIVAGDGKVYKKVA